MQIHKTKGIVLRTVKYGETSIITTVYTELFGIQSYIVKGVRQTSKKGSTKSNFFQTASILEMEVYHNELKNLQFIKEYQWAVVYENLFFDVVRNAVAVYIAEIIQHSLKQPEANPELYYLLEDVLTAIDKSPSRTVANIPPFFILQLGALLGFQIQGTYSELTPVLDLKEGLFVEQLLSHPFYMQNDAAETVSLLLNINAVNELEKMQLNQQARRMLIQSLQQYIALHIQDFGDLKSYAILQSILS